MDAGPGPGSVTTAALNGAETLDWQFLQCFGERTVGEEIQEGASKAGAANAHGSRTGGSCVYHRLDHVI